MLSVSAEKHSPSFPAPFLCKPGVTSVNFDERLQLYKCDKRKQKVKAAYKCAKWPCGTCWTLNAEEATIQHCAWTQVSIKIQNLVLFAVKVATNIKSVVLLNFLILLVQEGCFFSMCMCISMVCVILRHKATWSWEEVWELIPATHEQKVL